MFWLIHMKNRVLYIFDICGYFVNLGKSCNWTTILNSYDNMHLNEGFPTHIYTIKM